MFKNKFKNSIQFRFLSIMFGILFLGTLVTSLVTAINEGFRYRDTLINEGRSFASYIAQLSRDPLIMKNSVQLDAIVNDANKDENIAYTIICDEQGVPLTSQFASINYRLPRLNAILLELSMYRSLQDIIDKIKLKEPIIEVSIPIMVEPSIMGIKDIGMVTIGMAKYKMHQAITKTILIVIIINVGFAMLLSGVLFIASKKIIFDPISELAQASSRLAKGDLSTMVEIRTTGEVKTLIDSFNEMVGNLKKVTVSKDYVDNIFRSMINTLIVVSPDNKIMNANAAACRLLAYKEEELINRPVETVFAEKNSNRDYWMQKLLLNDYVGNIETWYRTKAGREVPIMLSASVMRDEHQSLRGIIYVAQDVTERKRAKEALKKSEKNLRFLSSQLLKSQETERKRIAVELHDGLGQALMVAKMRLRTIERSLPAGDSKEECVDLMKYFTELVENIRRLSHDLMPSVLEDLGLQVALQHLLDEFSRYTGIRVSTDLDDIQALFSLENQLIIYRIFQESLNNITKHAQATEVSVAMKREPGGVSFRLEDNGKGFDVRKVLASDSRKRGMGLAALEERVRMMGGSLEMRSQIGIGTMISFFIKT
jgi:PAS domain S-box-containing protein